MRLQFNDTGAWRNVLSFTEDRRREVMGAACALATVVGHGKLRLLNDDGSVYGHCDAPATGLWRIQ